MRLRVEQRETERDLRQTNIGSPKEDEEELCGGSDETSHGANYSVTEVVITFYALWAAMFREHSHLPANNITET